MTDFLMVGNGQLENIEQALKKADVLIQFNDCTHAAKLTSRHTRYIFLSNNGTVGQRLINSMAAKRNDLHYHNTELVLARNPTLSALKKIGMLLKRDDRAREYPVIKGGHRRLAKDWKVCTVSLIESARIEIKLLKLGMPPSFQPSTGLIAYEWLKRRLGPTDTISLVGFNFSGWGQHPWHIEKIIVQPYAPHFAWMDWEADRENGIE